jgi:O-antigen/teichoic acid export membrane protein
LQHSLPKSGHRSYFQKELLFRIWRFAAGLTGISVSAIILTQADKIILSKILPLEMFGYYTLATVVANTLYGFIGPVFSAMFPRFSQLVSLNDQDTLKELYHKACQFMSVMILPAAIVVSFFSSEILLLWTGDSLIVSNTHRIVSILIIGTALNGLMNLPYGLQLAYAWTTLSLYTNIIASIILVPMIYFLATRYGVIGAASAWVILNSGYVLIGIQIMHSRLLKGEQWRWYWQDVTLPASVALALTFIAQLVIPQGLQTFMLISVLLFILGLSSLAAALAAPAVRQELFNRFNLIRKLQYHE